MAFNNWKQTTDYVDKHAPNHARDDLMDFNLEAHLNRDHGFRLNDLMGEDYETKVKLHNAQHDLMENQGPPKFCPNCGHDLRY